MPQEGPENLGLSQSGQGDRRDGLSAGYLVLLLVVYPTVDRFGENTAEVSERGLEPGTAEPLRLAHEVQFTQEDSGRSGLRVDNRPGESFRVVEAQSGRPPMPRRRLSVWSGLCRGHCRPGQDPPRATGHPGRATPANGGPSASLQPRGHGLERWMSLGPSPRRYPAQALSARMRRGAGPRARWTRPKGLGAGASVPACSGCAARASRISESSSWSAPRNLLRREPARNCVGRSK